MEYDRISVSPIAGALGAEIDGVDISRPVDDATFAGIRRAWPHAPRADVRRPAAIGGLPKPE
jgi:hypothetical protein